MMAISLRRVFLAKRGIFRLFLRSFSAATVDTATIVNADETESKFQYPTTEHERQQRLADI